jgi:hypothetical protein
MECFQLGREVFSLNNLYPIRQGCLQLRRYLFTVRSFSSGSNLSDTENPGSDAE